MATRASEAKSSENKARAEASFKKDERAKDGAKAMMEYQANSRIVREKMARLKALRLAKETADKAADEA
ncbi:MAG: transcriptional regulator [Xanthobacteraceae bacterium]